MRYFSIRELTASATAKRLGIPNVPSWREKENLVALVDNVLDPLRALWKKPIIITSGYRSRLLNAAVGGSPTSQHTQGMAADIRTVSDFPNENKRLFELLVNSGIEYDQLIDEYGYDFIHLSYNRTGNRMQILHINK